MKLTKNKKILIGVLTVWPILYLFLSICFIFVMVFMVMHSHDIERPPTSFSILFALNFLTIIYLFPLIGFYIYYLFKTDRVPKDKKALWAIVIIFGNIIAMPVFWFLYIWREPKMNNILSNIGVTDDKGKYDQAISDFTKALWINPKDDIAYYNRGVAYGKKGQHDQAISDFDKALEINSRYAKAYYNRGVAYYLKKEYDKSREDVNSAQDLGYKIPAKFLEDLRKASGRQN